MVHVNKKKLDRYSRESRTYMHTNTIINTQRYLKLEKSYFCATLSSNCTKYLSVLFFSLLLLLLMYY